MKRIYLACRNELNSYTGNNFFAWYEFDTNLKRIYSYHIRITSNFDTNISEKGNELNDTNVLRNLETVP